MREVTVELPFKPWPHQRAAHAFLALFRFLVLVWHRRAGKTVFAVGELVLAALKSEKPRARFGYIAPLLKQAKGTAWDYLKHFARVVPGTSINETELSVEFPNGARVRLFGADNPDSLRGLYFDGVVLDEVADMKPQLWGEIIRPALADRHGWAIFIGTPKGVNLFSELYYRAQSEPEWKADLRRALDTGVLSAEELEQAKREMTPSQYAQEMDCDFGASVENVLLRLEDVLAAAARVIPNLEHEDSPVVCGLDVARFGDDSTEYCKRQGRRVFEFANGWRGLDTMQTAGRVAQLIETDSPAALFVDVTGVGAGVVDRLHQLGFSQIVVGVDFGARPINQGKFLNRRAEMWWLAAEFVKTGGGSIPADTKLHAQLTAPTYKFTPDGKLALEPKADIKKRGLPSPDKADALALTFAAPVAHRDLRPRFGGSLASAVLAGTNLGRRRMR